jgi:hypothetical protein
LQFYRGYQCVHHKKYFPQEPGFFEETWFSGGVSGFESVQTGAHTGQTNEDTTLAIATIDLDVSRAQKSQYPCYVKELATGLYRTSTPDVSGSYESCFCVIDVMTHMLLRKDWCRSRNGYRVSALLRSSRTNPTHTNAVALTGAPLSATTNSKNARTLAGTCWRDGYNA